MKLDHLARIPQLVTNSRRRVGHLDSQGVIQMGEKSSHVTNIDYANYPLETFKQIFARMYQGLNLPGTLQPEK
jgi:hypothetical protein